MTALASAITTALIASIWQDVIVAGGLAAALALLRGRSAQARYVSACAALAAMTMLPLMTGVSAYRDMRRNHAESTIARDAVADLGPQTAPVNPATSAFDDAARAFTVRDRAPATPAWVAAVRSWTLPFWCAGVLMFSLRLVGASLHAASLRRAGALADDDVQAMVARLATAMGITRHVDVIASAQDGGAATVGWLHPVILMPLATAMGLAPRQLEALIVHELAHIRRHDYAVNAAQLLIETIFFYHPAIWWTSRRIRIERELCCDDEAVRWTGDAHAYARALAKIAAAVPQPAMGAAGGSLRHRIERLLGVAPQRRTCAPQAAVLGVAIALVVAGAVLASAQAPNPAAAGAASLTGTLYDPFGRPAENTPIALLSRSRDINVIENSTTDAAGRFRFENLPRGRYSLTTPVSDAIRPARFDVASAAMKVDVHLGVDPVAIGIRVCAECAPSPPAVPASATQPGIPSNPVIAGAEPIGGWDAFNALTRDYPSELRRARVAGQATIEGRIAEDGTTAGAHVSAASNDQVAAAAVALVESLQWRPTLVHGTPVETPLQVTVEYALKDE